MSDSAKGPAVRDKGFELRLMLEVPAAERAARRGIGGDDLEHTRGIWAGIAETAGQ
jgi:DNA-binding GntR family transcriptional regulator